MCDAVEEKEIGYAATSSFAVPDDCPSILMRASDEYFFI